MIGQTIGHYKIVSKLGSGGMGEVYLAEDTTLDRKVALKFLPDALSKNPEARERLLREAKAASKLNHSNIVTVHAVGRDADRDFIAMEHVDGRPLDEYLAEKKRSTDELLRVAVQMARGLEHAHSAGVIHRDLKPANIFIDREDRVRILDFGLASLPGARKLTQTGSTVGTIAYMAPEQVQGQEADERSDLFSFGILLYEMLAGRPPFGGDHHAAIMYSILNDAPAPLAQYRADVPAGVEALVMRVLEKNPAHRYQSARDILADLRRLREGSGPSRIQSTVTPLPPSRRLPRFVIPAALATVALIVLLVLQPWKVEVSTRQEAQAFENRLAIMYFSNLNDPADSLKLGEIAANLLITNLSESKHMQVVSSQRLYDILKGLGHEGEKHLDPGMASQVAERARAKWMLMGSILQSSPNLVVTSQIVETSSGNAIASQRAEGAPGESIFAVADRLTQDIRGDLQIPVSVESQKTTANPPTRSEEAYRYYLEGVELRNRFYSIESEAALRKAVELDSTFAKAYVQLSILDRGSAAEKEAWIAAARRFSDNADLRTQRAIAVLEADHRGTDGELAAAMEKFLLDFPEDKEMLQGYMSILRAIGRYQDAVNAAHKVIELDSLNGMAYNALAYTYHDMGDYDKSITAINKYIELSPNDANPYDSRGDLYAFRGRYAEAIPSYRRALEINPQFSMSLMKIGDMSMFLGEYARAESCYAAMSAFADQRTRSLGREGYGLLLAFQGRFREAVASIDAALTADRMEKIESSINVGKYLIRVFCFEAIGNVRGAQKAADEAAEYFQRTVPTSILGLRGTQAAFAAKAGDFERADSILAEIKRLAEQSDSTQLYSYWAASGAVEYFRGDLTKAYQQLNRIPEVNREFWVYYHLVNIHLARAEPGDAIALLENKFSGYDDNAIVDAARVVKLHYLRGLAYEQSGWTKKVIESYDVFLNKWKNADPGIAEVDDARARLTALRSKAS